MNLKLSNQTIELDTQKLSEEDKKKLIEALEDDTWPKAGDGFYFIDDQNEPICAFFGDHATHDNARLSIGNIFRTKQEAEKHITYLKALQVLKGDTKGYEWKLPEEFYAVYYDTHLEYLKCNNLEHSWGEPVKFETREDAEQSIKLHEKEWHLVLLGEDK